MKKVWLLLAGSLSLISCADEKADNKIAAATAESKPVVRNLSEAQVMRGRQLYLKNCTVCHGINAEGAPDWQKRTADGSYPPPPLNGTGHAWHHPTRALVDVIRNGTIRLGGKMPPWKDKLSDEQIHDIIIWFQSQWPDELYAAWQRMDQESRQRLQ